VSWRVFSAEICGKSARTFCENVFKTAKAAKFLAKHAEKNNCQLSIINFQLRWLARVCNACPGILKKVQIVNRKSKIHS